METLKRRPVEAGGEGMNYALPEPNGKSPFSARKGEDAPYEAVSPERVSGPLRRRPTAGAHQERASSSKRLPREESSVKGSGRRSSQGSDSAELVNEKGVRAVPAFGACARPCALDL